MFSPDELLELRAALGFWGTVGFLAALYAALGCAVVLGLWLATKLRR